VAVIELLDQGPAMMNLMKSAKLAAREFPSILSNENIPVHYAVNLKTILDDKVVCEEVATGKTIEFPADTVLIAVGMKPLRDIAESMRHCAPETEVHVVGDARQVGSICTAVNEAFVAALHI